MTQTVYCISGKRFQLHPSTTKCQKKRLEDVVQTTHAPG